MLKPDSLWPAAFQERLQLPRARRKAEFPERLRFDLAIAFEGGRNAVDYGNISIVTAPPSFTSIVSRWPKSNDIPTNGPPSASRINTACSLLSQSAFASNTFVITVLPSPNSADVTPTKGSPRFTINADGSVRKPLKPVSTTASINSSCPAKPRTAKVINHTLSVC